MTLRELLAEVLEVDGEARAAYVQHYGFSNAADPCLRKLYRDLKFGGAPANDLRQVFMAVCGHAVGALCEKAAVRLGHKSQVQTKLDTGLEVSAEGNCDILVVKQPPTVPWESECVVDLKVIGEAMWEKLVRDKAPHVEHVWQVNGYAVAHKAPKWSLYYLRGVSIYERGELQWKAFHGEANAEQARKINVRWSHLRRMVQEGWEPEKPPDFKPDRFPCAWCGHRDYCFKEKAQ